MTKRWEKPKLIAIVRGMPEESVLVACKGGAITILPSDFNIECIEVITCLACNSTFAQLSHVLSAVRERA